MTKNAFVFDNVPIKKISYKKRKGTIEIKLYDGHYNLMYSSKANIGNQKEMNRIRNDLKAKGVNLLGESSWF